MPEKAESDERIKVSFQKVKEDIGGLKVALELQKNEIKDLNNKIKEILTSISEIKEKLDIFKKNSTGNKGVINDQQQSSTIINNHQQSPTIENIHSALSELTQSLTFAFQNLSDREFSIFAAIFEMEKQLPEVTYTDLANKLGISEPTVRSTVNRLISKKIPLNKVRYFNKKVSLSIPKDLHDINLITQLIQIHKNPHHQKTLFEI